MIRPADLHTALRTVDGLCPCCPDIGQIIDDAYLEELGRGDALGDRARNAIESSREWRRLSAVLAVDDYRA